MSKTIAGAGPTPAGRVAARPFMTGALWASLLMLTACSTPQPMDLTRRLSQQSPSVVDRDSGYLLLLDDWFWLWVLLHSFARVWAFRLRGYTAGLRT